MKIKKLTITQKLDFIKTCIASCTTARQVFNAFNMIGFINPKTLQDASDMASARGFAQCKIMALQVNDLYEQGEQYLNYAQAQLNHLSAYEKILGT